jgi:predicted NAD/FAD-binding protein
MKIAIVGAGISGLLVAHLLDDAHEVTVFEAAGYAGGHTNTVRIDTPNETHHVDTGFIVFNDRNYPRFERLLGRLGVASQASTIPSAVADELGDFEYSGSSPDGVQAKRAHWLEQQRFSRPFIQRLIVPQASALWSADPDQMWDFPARFFAVFFDNHGMLSLRGRPQRRTVRGGSARYVEALIARLRRPLRLATPIQSVTRTANHVTVTHAPASPSASSPTATSSRPWATTRPSGGYGRCTSPTSRPASSSGGSAMCSCCSPSRNGPMRSARAMRGSAIVAADEQHRRTLSAF